MAVLSNGEPAFDETLTVPVIGGKLPPPATGVLLLQVVPVHVQSLPGNEERTRPLRQLAGCRQSHLAAGRRSCYLIADGDGESALRSRHKIARVGAGDCSTGVEEADRSKVFGPGGVALPHRNHNLVRHLRGRARRHIDGKRIFPKL